ncbi:MAG: hypothetical protein ACK5TK_15860 [Betaproteobacteria bacterium]
MYIIVRATRSGAEGYALTVGRDSGHAPDWNNPDLVEGITDVVRPRSGIVITFRGSVDAAGRLRHSYGAFCSISTMDLRAGQYVGVVASTGCAIGPEYAFSALSELVEWVRDRGLADGRFASLVALEELKQSPLVRNLASSESGVAILPPASGRAGPATYFLIDGQPLAAAAGVIIAKSGLRQQSCYAAFTRSRESFEFYRQSRNLRFQLVDWRRTAPPLAPQSAAAPARSAEPDASPSSAQAPSAAAGAPCPAPRRAPPSMPFSGLALPATDGASLGPTARNPPLRVQRKRPRNRMSLYGLLCVSTIASSVLSALLVGAATFLWINRVLPQRAHDADAMVASAMLTELKALRAVVEGLASGQAQHGKILLDLAQRPAPDETANGAIRLGAPSQLPANPSLPKATAKAVPAAREPKAPDAAPRKPAHSAPRQPSAAGQNAKKPQTRAGEAAATSAPSGAQSRPKSDHATAGKESPPGHE